MIWNWLPFGRKPSLFELLNEDVTEVGRAVGATSAIASHGRLEAMSRAELIAFIKRQKVEIRELNRNLTASAKQIALQQRRLEHQADHNINARRLASLDARKDKESQLMRDQFQIRMKELNLQIATLEHRLLTLQQQNDLLTKRLSQKS